MRCKTVPYGVYSEVFGHSGAEGVFFYESPDVYAVHAASGSGDEEEVFAEWFCEFGAEFGQVSSCYGDCYFAHGDYAFFSSFAKTSQIAD